MSVKVLQQGIYAFVTENKHREQFPRGREREIKIYIYILYLGMETILSRSFFFFKNGILELHIDFNKAF